MPPSVAGGQVWSKSVQGCTEHCVQVAQQIRAAQQKAALQGQAPPAWAIGARCQALNPLDATWQEATVKGISATGNFVLAFTGREDELEEVLPLSPQEILDDIGAASPFICTPICSSANIFLCCGFWFVLATPKDFWVSEKTLVHHAA